VTTKTTCLVFPKIVNFVKMTLFAKKPGCGRVTCFCGTDNEFPQELKTVRFNLEPKRCKSVSLSTKRSVFTLVGLAHGVVTEKLRFQYKERTKRKSLEQYPKWLSTKNRSPQRSTPRHPVARVPDRSESGETPAMTSDVDCIHLPESLSGPCR